MPRSFKTGTWTSEEAYQLSKSNRAILELKVFAYLFAVGEQGATDEEIQLALEINGNSQRPARVKLRKDRSIKDSGKWRHTKSKRRAIVWVVSKSPE